MCIKQNQIRGIIYLNKEYNSKTDNLQNNYSESQMFLKFN